MHLFGCIFHPNLHTCVFSASICQEQLWTLEDPLALTESLEVNPRPDVDGSHEAFRLHSTRLHSPGVRNTVANSKGQTFSLKSGDGGHVTVCSQQRANSVEAQKRS